MRKNRLITMILLLAMCFCVLGAVACGGSTESDNGNNSNKVAVTFMVDGSKYAKVEVKEGAEFPVDPTKGEETFFGWYLDDGVWNNKFTDFSTVTKSITVYARFGQAVTLTYYVNNNVYHTDLMDGQSAITLPTAPSIDGFEFKGWYFKNYSGNWTTTKLTEDYFVNNNTTQNKTVYAKIQMVTKDNSSSGAYKINGNYLYMGKYPTSLASKNVSIKSEPNADGYYEDYSGNLYVKVESCVHNNQTQYPNIPCFFQDGNTIIEEGKTYYFKVETIKWVILEKDDDTALVMPTQVLFKSQYKKVEEEGVDVRDYENSDVRAYMNDTLYKDIFTPEERAVVLTSWVDNSKEKVCAMGTKCSWKDTYDKLYLLEFDFLTKLSNQQYLKLPVSDYMRATGMPMYNTVPTGGEYGYTYSWARGVTGSTPKGVAVIGTNAGAASMNANESMAYGVVPVFRVDL